MLYEFTRDARTVGKRLLLKGAVLFCLGLTFAVVFFWTAIIPVLMLLPILLGLVMLYDGGIQTLRSGTWWIHYDGEQLSWQAPVFAEESFTIHNGDIDKVIATIRQTSARRGGGKKVMHYAIHTRAGKTYHLTEQSGVEVATLVSLLQNQGVRVEEELSE